MFEIPGSDVVSVHITEDVVKNKHPPVYIRGKQVTEEEDQAVEVQAWLLSRGLFQSTNASRLISWETKT